MIDKFLVGFTFLDELAFSSADFNMNFWTSFSFITNKITHFLNPPFTLLAITLDGNKYSIFRSESILEHKIWKCQEKNSKKDKIIRF
jgi:hypothetical protein